MQARRNLEIVRGTKDVDTEFADIQQAADLAATVKNPWRLFFSKKYRPQLVLCAFSTLFQQWTGMPVLAIFCYFISLRNTRSLWRPHLILRFVTRNNPGQLSAKCLTLIEQVMWVSMSFVSDRYTRRFWTRTRESYLSLEALSPLASAKSLA